MLPDTASTIVSSTCAINSERRGVDGYQGAALAFSEFDVLKRQLVETLLYIYTLLLAEKTKPPCSFL